MLNGPDGSAPFGLFSCPASRLLFKCATIIPSATHTFQLEGAMRTVIIIALPLIVALFAIESGGATFPSNTTQTRQQPGSTQSTTGTAAFRPRVVNTQQMTITGSSTDSRTFSPVRITTQQMTITGSTPDMKFTPANITTQQLTITGPPNRR